MLAGVDGYKKRWVAALADEDGATRLELVDSFVNLIERAELELIVIDVPIRHLSLYRMVTLFRHHCSANTCLGGDGGAASSRNALR